MVARNSQNIHECHEDVKLAHIDNGDVTLISRQTFDKYNLDSLELKKIEVDIGDSAGYAVYNENKIDDKTRKNIELLEKGELSLKKTSLLLSSEVPNKDTSLYNLAGNPNGFAHRESLDLFIQSNKKLSSEEKNSLKKMLDNLDVMSLDKTETKQKVLENGATDPKSFDEYYILDGKNPQLSKVLKSLVQSIEIKIVMPVKSDVLNKVDLVDKETLSKTCVSSLKDRVNELGYIPKSKEATFESFFMTCQQANLVKVNLGNFNGAGQAMTKAGSVYIPFKYDESLIDDLKDIAKDNMRNFASRLENSRENNGISAEL